MCYPHDPKYATHLFADVQLEITQAAKDKVLSYFKLIAY